VHKDVDCSSNQPCQKCEGDCDHDGQCTGFLICYRRHGYINIPGCAGSGVQHKDYCIDPTDSPDLPLILVNGDGGNCSENNPCNICEGDCDSDTECASGLECFKRGDFASVPGCSGSGDWGRDYCYHPSTDYRH